MFGIRTHCASLPLDATPIRCLSKTDRTNIMGLISKPFGVPKTTRVNTLHFGFHIQGTVKGFSYTVLIHALLHWERFQYVVEIVATGEYTNLSQMKVAETSKVQQANIFTFKSLPIIF